MAKLCLNLFVQRAVNSTTQYVLLQSGGAAVLNWSDTSYKFTLGLGSLAIVGLLSELIRPQLSVWIAMAIALLPFVVFVFIHPGELPDRLVACAHVAASSWYLLTVTGLLFALAVVDRPLARGWFIVIPCAAAGAVPCFIVLSRWIEGNYPPPPVVDYDSYQLEEKDASPRTDEDKLNWG